jgi:hypothetical protein
MCAELNTALRIVAADFFFNCWCLEISSDNRIRSTEVNALSCARPSNWNFPEFLYWKWKPYPIVVSHKSKLV